MSEEPTQQPALPPPKYQRKADSIFARQFMGENFQDMLDFAPGYLYLTPEGVLMQANNPFPIAITEWVCQYRNTEKIGTFFRQTNDIFDLTWAVGGP